MYESDLSNDRILRSLLKGKDPAISHQGRVDRLMRVHQRHVGLFHSGICGNCPDPRPLLFKRIADSRTLHAAARSLMSRGKTAAGPNGLRLDDYPLRSFGASAALLRRV